MSYCIFDSESEAQAYNAQALADWLTSHDVSPYKEQTTAWGDVRQRVNDLKWFISVCSITDNTGQTIEDSDPSWFPAEDLPT